MDDNAVEERCMMKDQPVSIITGSYSGIGAVLTSRLAAAGHELILLNRQKDKTLSQVREIKAAFPEIKVNHAIADFADLEQLKSVAINIAVKHKTINFAYLNAGWIGTTFQRSAQGLDMNFQVNVLANYVLLQLLRPSFVRGRARVIASGSGARQMVRKTDIELVQNQGEKAGMAAYAQSKQALVDLFLELSTEMSKDRILLEVVDLPPTRTDYGTQQSGARVYAVVFIFVCHPRKSGGQTACGSKRRQFARAAEQRANRRAFAACRIGSIFVRAIVLAEGQTRRIF